MVKDTTSKIPDYAKTCDIIANAFQEDMRVRKVNYSVHLKPKGKNKMEIQIDNR